MKELTVSIFYMLIICSYSNAQSDHKSPTNKNRAGINTPTSKNKRTTAIDTLTNTRNYQWNDGQTATPTGEEATGTNTERFVSNKKDSVKLKATKKKQ